LALPSFLPAGYSLSHLVRVMPGQRSLRLDLLALALFASCVFLGVALATYNPADFPSTVTYPPPGKVFNSCGRSGAFVAEWTFRVFGVSAWFVLVSLSIFDALLLRRRRIGEPVLRTIGWLMALIGICTLAALAISRPGVGPVIGPGGYVGAAGRTILEMNFAAIGSYVLTLSVIAAGLLLCTDYVLVRITALVVGKPTVAAAKLGHRALAGGRVALKKGGDGPRVKNKAKRSDVDEPPANAAHDDDESRPEIKVHGKRGQEDAYEDSEDDSDDVDENEASQAGAQVAGAIAKPTIGERLASALRIKNRGKHDEREQVISELEAAARREDDTADYELPPIDLLLPNETVFQEEHEKEVRDKAKKLEATFANFGFKVKVVEIETGPVIAQYEVELEAGLRLSKITSLADDLAIALRVPSVRIVAPIPGKNTVGIEVPNASRQLVRLREVIEETNGKAKKMRIPVYLGKDVAGNPMVIDLTTLPHLLIAGRTGTGKSVCLNSIIVSMLMTRRPDEVKMLMIDPKMVELSPYKRLPHLMHPVVTDMRKAEAILAWAVEKMEERYALLARAGVRHVSVYNQLGEEELMDRLQPENDEERASIPLHLPYIVIVADEMADLMMTSGKEVEQHIIRLAQKSRAVGIHLILATQKPTVDVITGLIKSNLPARIAFQVASRVDSRVVLDEMGAERLLGNGDLLFLWPGTSMLLRGQGTYLSDDEINKVVDFVGTTEPQFAKELVALRPKSDDPNKPGFSLQNRDELYETAVDIVIREGRGSVSLLQRALGIGYGRAARLIDYMAEDGIVGEYNGSQAREVLITLEQWAEMSGAQAEPEPPSKPKRNVILPQRGEELDEHEEEDGDDEDDDDNDDDPPPIRGPHNRPKGATTFGDRVPLEPRSKGGLGARMAIEDEDIEDDEEVEDDDELEDDDCESDEDEDDADDGAALDDDRYANINPALLARLRQKRLQDREQRFRRSA
jgi:DNA segregation ATPase FtsK/SpoIIIE, S-DNA-T family